MYIAHTVPGRYPFYPKSLVLYLEEEEGPSMAWACVRHSVLQYHCHWQWQYYHSVLKLIRDLYHIKQLISKEIYLPRFSIPHANYLNSDGLFRFTHDQNIQLNTFIYAGWFNATYIFTWLSCLIHLKRKFIVSFSFMY